MKKRSFFILLFVFSIIFAFASNGTSGLELNNESSITVDTLEEDFSAGLYRVCTGVEITTNNFIQGPCSKDCGPNAARICALENARRQYPDAIRVFVISSKKISDLCL